MTDIEALATQEYKYGFVTDIESILCRRLDEDTILRSGAEEEPVFMWIAAEGVSPTG